MIGDLLARLQEETRRGAGSEVDNDPTPSTRGTGEYADSNGRAQVDDGFARNELARRRARARSWPSDVEREQDREILRQLCRAPWTLTFGQPCPPDCRHLGHPRHYEGLRIAESLCERDGTCWTVETAAERRFFELHGRNPTRDDARFVRGVPVNPAVEAREEQPIEKLAKGRVGQPPKMTDRQIDDALAELAGGDVTVRALSLREWQRWGFKNPRSAEAALRRYQRIRPTNHNQEVLAA